MGLTWLSGLAGRAVRRWIGRMALRRLLALRGHPARWRTGRSRLGLPLPRVRLPARIWLTGRIGLAGRGLAGLGLTWIGLWAGIGLTGIGLTGIGLRTGRNLTRVRLLTRMGLLPLRLTRLTLLRWLTLLRRLTRMRLPARLGTAIPGGGVRRHALRGRALGRSAPGPDGCVVAAGHVVS